MVIYHGRKQKITIYKQKIATNNTSCPSSLVIFFGLPSPRIQVCSKDLGYAPSDLATMVTYHKSTIKEKFIPGIRKQLPSLQIFKVFPIFCIKIHQTFYPSLHISHLRPVSVLTCSNGTGEDAAEGVESALIGGWHHLGDVHHQGTCLPGCSGRFFSSPKRKTSETPEMVKKNNQTNHHWKLDNPLPN